ncbi:GroES-like protein [Dichomitus squalens]|uniref:GroES-like protein n=1 Tax=Dichomitus squalens TaxID=114155 RepID=A0A4Q9P8R4_9APHY|nr:GroES-like protein [Dichomitus squalens]TBU65360.1 GroES-like protein [Dichomitus squalens]
MSVAQHKALILESKLGQFAVKTVQTPKPGPEEVLVKIEATALNPLDWKVQALGILIERYPTILGFDAAGSIFQIGEEVPPTLFAVGDRVLVQGWFDLAEQSAHGTFTQYFLLPYKLVAKIPDSLAYEDAATIPTGVATAGFPLYNQNESAASVRLTPPWVKGGRGKYAGRPILVIGGASSMGQFAIQFARLSGFSPIVTTASPHNTPLLQTLGATHVLDRKLSSEELIAEATKITGGPFEVVYDAIASEETSSMAYAVTARGGHLVTVLSNPALELRAKEEGKNVDFVHGVFKSEVNRDIGRSLLDALPGLLKSGDIKPNRTEILPGGLNGVVEGLERLKNDQVSGVKLVVRPQETA